MAFDPFNPDDQMMREWQENLPQVPRPGFQPEPPAPPAGEPSLEEFEKNYWAPDREAVLAQKRGEKNKPPAAPTPPKPFNVQEFKSGWLGSGGMTPGDLQNFINQQGYAGQVQTLGGKGDKIRLPNGQVVDAVFAAGLGGRGAQWLEDVGGAPAAAFGSSAGGAIPGAPAGVPSGTGGIERRPLGTTGAAGPTIDDQMMQAIQRLLGRGFADVTAENPNIQAQFAPVSRTLQRGAERTRAAAAERAAQQGLNLGGAGGAFDASVNAINENLATEEGALMANLIGNELASRRDDIKTALGYAQGQQKLDLERQLSSIDAELRRLQLSQQNQQYYAGLGLQGQQLAQQNQQFYDRFGYDVGLQEYLLNQALNQGLLGGS